MSVRTAIVTGGLRGLGKAMTIGFAREGYLVLAMGHIDNDAAQMRAETKDTPLATRIIPVIACRSSSA